MIPLAGEREPLNINHKTSAEKVEAFLFQEYKGEIQEAFLKWPDITSITIDFHRLDRHDSHLGDMALEKPSEFLSLLSKESHKLRTNKSDSSYTPLYFRLANLPSYALLDNLRKVNTNVIGKLVGFKGLVRRKSDNIAILKEGIFECRGCMRMYNIPATIDGEPIEPSLCSECQGRSFRFVPEESEYKDVQYITVQDTFDQVRGDQPRTMTLVFEEDIIDTVMPGDLIQVTGIPRLRKVHKKKHYTFIIETNYVLPLIKSFDDVKLNDDDVDKIISLSQEPDVFDKLSSSLAPMVKGHEKVKEAITCQLFGGTDKELNDGTSRRSQSHILLIGDPGTGKTMLLSYTSDFAPNGITASGKGSTGVGLTAAAIKDEEGNWNLEAGALVLADRGVVCIDEFDKMREDDRSYMHDAMEKQEIYVTKAGIIATLPTRTSILAAANPKGDRFDRYKSIKEQINLPSTLLSRFDLIFAIEDKPDIEQDKEVIKHVFRKHREMKVDVPVDMEMFRKYIAYARQNCHPLHTDESEKLLSDFYLELRGSASDEDPMPVTPRQLEGLIRLSEASAKVHLRDEVTVEDSQRAINILKECLKQVGYDPETGKLDIDIVEGRKSNSERRILKKVDEIVEDYRDEFGDILDYNTAVEEVSHQLEVSESKAKGLIKQLRRM